MPQGGRKLLENMAPYDFEVKYQPRISLETWRVLSAEALARFRDGRHGHLPTAQTIAKMERANIIDAFTRQLVDRVADDMRLILGEFGGDCPSVSINVSPQSLGRTGFVDEIHDVFRRSQIDPRLVELELTETAAEDDPEAFLGSCARARQLGYRLAIDDFGVGASGLIRLDLIPATTIKIDRHFVSGVRLRDTSRHIISLVASYARSTGLFCVAEGVETEDELRFVRSCGCHEAQGYFFSPPLALGEYVDMLRLERDKKNLSDLG